MTRHASCCVTLCANNFRNSPCLAFYRISKAHRIQREYVRLLGNANLKLNSDSTWNCILLVFLEVKSPQVHLPSASEFHVVSVNSTFRFAILSCFNPAGTFHFASAMFVYIHVPPNIPINAHPPSLGPRLSLFSEESYGGIAPFLFLFFLYH